MRTTHGGSGSVMLYPDDYKPDAVLEAMLAAVVDGTLSNDRFRQLEDRLKRDEQARSFFVEYLQLHATIDWNSVALAAELDFSDSAHLESCVLPEELHCNIASLKSRVWLSKKVWSVIALAASVLVLLLIPVIQRTQLTEIAAPQVKESGDLEGNGLGAGMVHSELDAPLQADAVARHAIGVVRVAEAVQIRGDMPALAPGHLLLEGTYGVAQGTLVIGMFAGAELCLVGPCEVRFDSGGDVVHCVSGHVAVDVVNPNSRIKLVTPVGELLHIGTAYQLDVNGDTGATSLHVLDGEVQLVSESLASAPRSSRVFGDGASVVMHPAGNIARTPVLSAPDTWAKTRLNSHGTLPYVTAAGFTTQLALARGTRASGAERVTEWDATIRSIEEAEQVLQDGLAAEDAIQIEGVSSLDFQDGFDKESYLSMRDQYVNLFNADARVPGMPSNTRPNECFVVRATCHFVVEDSWEYSFAVNSDDGCRLRIDGNDVIIDDAIHPPQQSVGTILLEAGLHSLELLSFDHYGFYRLELGVAPGRVRSLKSFSLLQTKQ